MISLLGQLSEISQREKSLSIPKYFPLPKVTEAAPRKRVLSQGTVCPEQNNAVPSGGGEGRRNDFNCFMTFHDNYENSKTPACPYQILSY